jgi:hypothetical protein
MPSPSQQSSSTARPSVRPTSQSSNMDSQSIPTESQDAFQQQTNAKVLEDLVARMSRCHTIGELIKTIPVPAQENTKGILEKVNESFTRHGACSSIHASWQDALDKGEFERIPELNSLRPPIVQTSKLAKEVDEVALTTLNFTSVIADARKAALTQMIAIKAQEIKNLRRLCDGQSIRDKIIASWLSTADSNSITPEHQTILTHRGCAERLVQMAISIGQDSLTRTANIKKKKLEKKAETDIEMTDAVEDPKKFEAMFHEMMKRERQSEKDKRIHNGTSKKGRGRAGPPRKTKNQAKNRASKVQKKAPQPNVRKSGTSTTRRQKKR